MDFQRMGEKANAGRFERGCLKATAENLTSWTLSKRERPPRTDFQRCSLVKIAQIMRISSLKTMFILFFMTCFSFFVIQDEAPPERRVARHESFFFRILILNFRDSGRCSPERRVARHESFSFASSTFVIQDDAPPKDGLPVTNLFLSHPQLS